MLRTTLKRTHRYVFYFLYRFQPLSILGNQTQKHRLREPQIKAGRKRTCPEETLRRARLHSVQIRNDGGEPAQNDP